MTSYAKPDSFMAVILLYYIYICYMHMYIYTGFMQNCLSSTVLTVAPMDPLKESELGCLLYQEAVERQDLVDHKTSAMSWWGCASTPMVYIDFSKSIDIKIHAEMDMDIEIKMNR